MNKMKDGKKIKEDVEKVEKDLEKAEKNIIQKIKHHPQTKYVLIIIALLLVAAGIFIYTYINSRIYIEKSEINAPIISIGPEKSGILEKLLVKEGDIVGKGKVVAIVGDQELKTITGGVVVEVKDVPGQMVTSSDQIVKIIEPKKLRLIGHLEEDKGLKDVHPGQKVIFTADAFGSKKYYGTVEFVAQSSKQSAITFSISDKREMKQFDITVRYDEQLYNELKNGMSAKMWIYR
jgi:multidrug resistance efflux pump